MGCSAQIHLEVLDVEPGPGKELSELAREKVMRFARDSSFTGNQEAGEGGRNSSPTVAAG
jgi:hypothetical protein